MPTILPKKTIYENPIATDDEAYAQLVADPTIPAFTNIYSNQPTLTNAAPTNAASNAEILVRNRNEHWLNSHWRPAMGWVYMVTCITDFILFPIAWSMLQAITHGNVLSQWQPLTLQGAGLYHIAMGAVLGIAAYGRTREKLNGSYSTA